MDSIAEISSTPVRASGNTKAPSWQRPDRLLVAGGFLSLIGSAGYTAAEQLQVKGLTESVTWLGMVIIVIRLIQFVIGPIAGVFADRSDPRRSLISLDLAMGALSLMMAAVFLIVQTRGVQLVMLLASAAMLSLFTEIYIPFFSVATGKMFEDQELRKLQSFKAQATEVARLAGPSLGALLFKFGGIVLASTVNGFSFVVSAVLVARALPYTAAVARSARPRQSLAKKLQNFFIQFGEGLTYLRHQRGLIGFVSGAAITNMFITAMQVSLPFLISNERHWSAAYFGYALSAMALGSFAGAGLARRALSFSKIRQGQLILVALPVPGLFWIATGLSPAPWLMLVTITLANTAFAFVGVSLMPKIISETAPEFRGRVFSVLMNLTAILTPPGALIAGQLLDHKFIAVGRLFEVCGLAIVITWLLVLLDQPTRHWVSGAEAGPRSHAP